MPKILKFEVQEGNTNCNDCPFWAFYVDCGICNKDGICDRVDFCSIKFIGEE